MTSVINDDPFANTDDPSAMPEIDEVFADAIDFDSIIQPGNWQHPGEYYRSTPAKTHGIVRAVVEGDERLRRELREEWFPKLLSHGDLLGWHRADPTYMNLLQKKRLFTGQVVAADGTLSKYETLSLVGAQIGISKVSYRGHTGQIVANLMCWGQEIPRNATAGDIVRAIQSRGDGLKDRLPNLVLYALMLYKERQILLESGPNAFKLIQGTLFPHEMLSGSGQLHTLVTCLTLIGKLIDDGNYATIVSKDSHRDLELFGMALNPGEYILTSRGTEILQHYFDTANFTDTPISKYGGRSQKQVFREFQKTYGPKVVQGVLRSHPMAKPYVFYCNANRVKEAVHILLADASNSGPRGFPLLIDFADHYCSGSFQAGEYTNRMNAEFVRAARGSGIYQSERTTRD